MSLRVSCSSLFDFGGAPIWALGPPMWLPWLPFGSHLAPFWLPLAPFGSLWRLLAPFGSLSWLHLAPLWLTLALLQAPFGFPTIRYWLPLAPFWFPLAGPPTIGSLLAIQRLQLQLRRRSGHLWHIHNLGSLLGPILLISTHTRYNIS